MSLPVSIEGQSYFVSFLTLGDFRTLRQFLARELRIELGESIPSGLPDDELKRRMQFIGEQCDAINPLERKWIDKLTKTPDGAALFFYSWLRHESPGLTLDWVKALILRCEEGKPAALAGFRELRTAITELVAAKKNEMAALLGQQPPKTPETVETTAGPSTSNPSTSQ